MEVETLERTTVTTTRCRFQRRSVSRFGSSEVLSRADAHALTTADKTNSFLERPKDDRRRETRTRVTPTHSQKRRRRRTGANRTIRGYVTMPFFSDQSVYVPQEKKCRAARFCYVARTRRTGCAFSRTCFLEHFFSPSCIFSLRFIIAMTIIE